MQDDQETQQVYREAIEQCEGSKYIFCNYLLYLEMTRGSIQHQLDELSNKLKSSSMSDTDKKDIFTRLVAIYEERGYSLDQIDCINEYLNDLAKSLKHHLEIA
jgi:hypothetical protein